MPACILQPFAWRTTCRPTWATHNCFCGENAGLRCSEHRTYCGATFFSIQKRTIHTSTHCLASTSCGVNTWRVTLGAGVSENAASSLICGAATLNLSLPCSPAARTACGRAPARSGATLWSKSRCAAIMPALGHPSCTVCMKSPRKVHLLFKLCGIDRAEVQGTGHEAAQRQACEEGQQQVKAAHDKLHNPALIEAAISVLRLQSGPRPAKGQVSRGLGGVRAAVLAADRHRALVDAVADSHRDVELCSKAAAARPATGCKSDICGQALAILRLLLGVVAKHVTCSCACMHDQLSARCTRPVCDLYANQEAPQHTSDDDASNYQRQLQYCIGTTPQIACRLFALSTRKLRKHHWDWSTAHLLVACLRSATWDPSPVPQCRSPCPVVRTSTCARRTCDPTLRSIKYHRNNEAPVRHTFALQCR